MKSIISVFLMAFAFAACGGKAEENENDGHKHGSEHCEHEGKYSKQQEFTVHEADTAHYGSCHNHYIGDDRHTEQCEHEHEHAHGEDHNHSH